MSEGAIVTYHDINRLYELMDNQETRLRMVEERTIVSDEIIKRCAESIDRGVERESENYKQLSNTMNLVNSSMIDIQMTLKDVHNENKNNKQYTKSVDEKVDEKFNEINFKIDKVNEEFQEDKKKNIIDTRDVQKEIQTNWLKENWLKVAGTGGLVAICGLLVKLIEALSKISK